MKNVFAFVTMAAVGMGFLASAEAQVVNPNGFPSGLHYNLNIIGKKADYNCTPAPVDEFGNYVFGNVVFIPETGEDIQIVIKSGKKGGAASAYTDLQVTDACAVFDGDPAELQLPPSEKGYRVYARALAKPVNTNWEISYGGSLFSAIDENGFDLVDLGLVTSGGVASTGETLVRSKGKSTAIDISKLFLWSGTVCSIDYSSLTSIEPTDTTGYLPFCWVDADPIGLINSGDTLTPALPDGLGGFTCTTAGAQLIWLKVTCTTYTDYWIFNIADLVSSDWLVDNNGTKLVQIRFYPLQ